MLVNSFRAGLQENKQLKYKLQGNNEPKRHVFPPSTRRTIASSIKKFIATLK